MESAGATSNGAAPDVEPKTGQRPPDIGTALGRAVLLLMSQPAYRHLFLADLEWMLLPPILLNQYRLFSTGGRIMAFAAWATLSEAVEARINAPNQRLSPAEWKSGDNLWLIHLVAPFGHGEAVLKELRETVFAGKSFKMHRPRGNRPTSAKTAPVRAKEAMQG